jgi:hypothetical protein
MPLRHLITPLLITPLRHYFHIDYATPLIISLYFIDIDAIIDYYH